MLISHEVPKCLFGQSTHFNDYPYVLGHLIKLDSQYKEFYKKELRNWSFSILDNSAFELGKSIPFDELMSVARELRPSHLVLPDTVHDKDTTLRNSLSFWSQFCTELIEELEITPIGVVQGDTFEELLECIYTYREAGVRYIAIPFDCIKNSDYSIVRFQFFIWLYAKLGHSEMSKLEFHFLGIQNPQEMLLYSSFIKNYIKSIDTSSPILHGIAGNSFGKWGVMSTKPKMKLADNLDIKIDRRTEERIYENVEYFKNYCNHDRESEVKGTRY